MPAHDSRKLLAVLTGLGLVASACGRTAAGDSGGGSGDPASQPPVRLQHAPTVRYHMQRHVDDLRTIERMLIEGYLDEAKALAFMLTKPEADPGMAPWAAESRRAIDAARGLAAARSIPEALRYEVRVAGACGSCHVRMQQRLVFAPLPRLAPEDGTVPARMTRHQWAVDRLWEGLVGPNDDRWRAGLEVLAAAPPAFLQRGEEALATRLQRRARKALAVPGTGTLEDRASTYGEMLITCAACHGARDR